MICSIGEKDWEYLKLGYPDIKASHSEVRAVGHDYETESWRIERKKGGKWKEIKNKRMKIPLARMFGSYD